MQIRNVNTNQYMGELPSFLYPILERLRSFEGLDHAADTSLDQLTVKYLNNALFILLSYTFMPSILGLWKSITYRV